MISQMLSSVQMLRSMCVCGCVLCMCVGVWCVLCVSGWRGAVWCHVIAFCSICGSLVGGEQFEVIWRLLEVVVYLGLANASLSCFGGLAKPIMGLGLAECSLLSFESFWMHFLVSALRVSF